MKCSNCGRISPEGSKVCMMCGMPFGKVKYCQKCGNLIDSDAVFCPQCGWKHGESTPEPAQETKDIYTNPVKQAAPKKARGIAWKIFSWIGFAFGMLFSIANMPSFTSILLILFSLIAIPIDSFQNFWKSKKIKGTAKGVLLLLLFFFAIAATPESERTEKNEPERREKNVQSVSKEEKEPPTEPEKKALVADTSFDTAGYMNIDSEVLFEYGGYLSGQKVVTVITAADVDAHSGMVKAKTPNNNGYFFSIVCEFSEKPIVESVEEGTMITVAGTIKEKNPLAETISFLDTPTANLENCTIIGFGEIEKELKGGIEEQRTFGEQAKQTYEAQIAAANKEEKDSYIAQCETVSYSDVERNPDNYKGKLVKFTGKVVQVSEGWFDSVTMRIDSNGNMWYVTYTREDGESRILEDDRITCYGECGGVTSYKSVLGSQVTIPSINMKYYD